MFIILLSTHSVAHPLCHPDKDDTLDDHVITLVQCCWRESQSSRGLAGPPRRRAAGYQGQAADRLGATRVKSTAGQLGATPLVSVRGWAR